MRELLPDLESWLNAGERVALATVLSTWGSAPRLTGSVMAVSESGGMVGSVSGGCVEGAVVQAAQEVIRSQRPQRLQFGVADETAWDVGLACGGSIDIFVQPVQTTIFDKLLPRLKQDQASTLSTLIAGPEDQLGAQQLTDEKNTNLATTDEALFATIQIEETGKQSAIIKLSEGTEFFVNRLAASPTLVMIGGVHIAVALAELARTLNFRTVIVDPRKAFNTGERFAHADQIIQAWPQNAFEQFPLTAATAVASLSHDPKIDDPALITALASDAFYVGALGSTRTQAKRRERLLKAGVSEENLARLHTPIGIEIHAETPEEIALAIMAQVISAYRS